MEMEENEHQLRVQSSSIGNVEKKYVEQYLKPESHCCIYRIPQFIGKLNKAAYTPNLISIGPLHCGNEELMRMESQKKRYRAEFEDGVGRRQVLEKFRTRILNEEQSIRAQYSVASNLQTSEYVELILQDAIFIIELFLKTYSEPEDFLLKSPMVSYIVADLLMVENQLPYSLLEQLYLIVFPDNGINRTFFHLCIRFFEQHLDMYCKVKDLASSRRLQFKHFIDFVRCVLVMEAKIELKSDNGMIDDIPCATKLKKSGLKFKGHKNKSLLDIKFAKTKKCGKWLQWFGAHEIQIPTLQIDDYTEILLRNLMAWEMFHYPGATHICNYVALMDELIDTKEDVDLLVEKDIIVSYLGNNEAIAQMFNELCLNTTVSKSCYYETVEKMKAHYGTPWNHFKATFRSDYCSNPWRSMATAAAIFLVIFTLMQTICSVIQVYQGYTK